MAQHAGVTVEDLRVARGARWVLDGLTVTFGAGELTAITGANGAGKSTLLDVLAGLRHPDSGTVLQTASERVAFAPQHTEDNSLLPITVRKVVEMGRWSNLGLWRRMQSSDRAIVEDWMAALAITDVADRRLQSLSGGQRQRALIARALATEAACLIVDEPTSGLDSGSADRVINALTQAAQRGAVVVAATHDDHLIGAADRVIALHEPIGAEHIRPEAS